MRATQGRDPAIETQPQRQVGSGWPGDWRSLGGTISSLERAHSARTPCGGKGHQEWASEGYGTSLPGLSGLPSKPSPTAGPSKDVLEPTSLVKRPPWNWKRDSNQRQASPAAPGPPRPASDHHPPTRKPSRQGSWEAPGGPEMHTGQAGPSTHPQSPGSKPSEL